MKLTLVLLKAMIWIHLLVWNERRRLRREKRLSPASGKRPPVVENQQSSLTEP
ncbi:MAG: hypothetical protein ACE3JN_02075 [Ectobacillus sp.]